MSSQQEELADDAPTLDILSQETSVEEELPIKIAHFPKYDEKFFVKKYSCWTDEVIENVARKEDIITINPLFENEDEVLFANPLVDDGDESSIFDIELEIQKISRVEGFDEDQLKNDFLMNEFVEQINPLHWNFDSCWSGDFPHDTISEEFIEDNFQETTYNILYSQTTESCPPYLPDGFILSDVMALITNMKQDLQVRSQTKSQNSWKNYQAKYCCSSSELFEWCLQYKKEEGYGMPQDARCFLQLLLDKQFLIPVPFCSFPIFDETNDEQQYRFLEDEDPSFYRDVVNVKPKMFSAVTTRNSTENTIEANGSTMEEIMYSFYRSELATPFLISYISDLAAQIFKHVNSAEKFVDYAAITNSEAFKTWTQFSPNLRLIDWTQVLRFVDEEAKKCLFINLFNLMATHALLIRGCASTQTARQEFLYKPFYFFGRNKLSLADILFGILGTCKPPSYKYYLESYSVQELDPRIYFVLSSGYASCPLPKAVNEIDCDRILEYCTKQYINAETEVGERKVVLPYQFELYREDLGGTLLGLLHFALKYLGFEKKKTILSWLKEEFDWDEKKLEEIVKTPYYLQPTIETFEIVIQEPIFESQRFPRSKLQPQKKEGSVKSPSVEEEEEHSKRYNLDDIKADVRLRQYFHHFCKMEYSEENILFFEEVQKFRVMDNPKAMVDTLRKIYNEYLSSSAPREVNVTRILVKTIEDILSETECASKVNPFILDDLAKEVDMVLMDSYSRFEVSEVYSQMVENAKRKSRRATIARRQNSGTLFAAKSNTEHAKTPRSPSILGAFQSLASDDSKGLAGLVREMKALKSLSSLTEEHSSPTSSKTDSPRTPLEIEKTKESYTPTQIFKVPLKIIFARESETGPAPLAIEELLKYVETEAVTIEGLYRISGAQNEVTKLKNLLDQNKSIQVELDTVINKEHTVTGIIKQFFRELPEPLLTVSKFEDFISVAKMDNIDEQIKRIRELVISLPVENYFLLGRILQHFQVLVQHSAVSKMSSSNIAISFGLNLLRNDEDPMKLATAMPAIQHVIDLLITHAHEILHYPLGKPFSKDSVGNYTGATINANPPVKKYKQENSNSISSRSHSSMAVSSPTTKFSAPNAEIEISKRTSVSNIRESFESKHRKTIATPNYTIPKLDLNTSDPSIQASQLSPDPSNNSPITTVSGRLSGNRTGSVSTRVKGLMQMFETKDTITSPNKK